MNELIGYFGDLVLNPPRNGIWIRSEIAEIYVRIGSRRCLSPGSKAIECVDIANIIVFEEYQNSGVFKQFLSEAEDIVLNSKYKAIYIENVLTDRFANFFTKRGYLENTSRFEMSQLPKCFYKNFN